MEEISWQGERLLACLLGYQRAPAVVLESGRVLNYKFRLIHIRFPSSQCCACVCGGERGHPGFHC